MSMIRCIDAKHYTKHLILITLPGFVANYQFCAPIVSLSEFFHITNSYYDRGVSPVQKWELTRFRSLVRLKSTHRKSPLVEVRAYAYYSDLACVWLNIHIDHKE